MLNLRTSTKEQIYTIHVRSISILFNRIIFSNILMLLIVTVCCQQATAQEIKAVKEVVARLDSKKSERLNSLMYDVQPTIYLENGEVKIFGEGAPVYLKSDISSIKLLSTSNSKFNSIEFLEIRLTKNEDENSLALDASVFENLSSLKYLLVRSEYQIDNQKFEKILSGVEKYGVTPLYEIFILE